MTPPAAHTGDMNRDDLASVIGCAELAPSVHNTQPWKCTAAGNSIEVRADRQRHLAVLDPTGRELTVSCGAAIEFAVIAARGLGWDCTTRLLPDPADADLLAVIDIGERRAVETADRELLEAIPRRYTDRGRYEPRLVTADLLEVLDQGVAHRGVWLRVMDHEGDRLAVIQALTDAEAAEAADPAYREELAAWLRSGHAPDGIPPTALGSEPVAGQVNDVPARDFSGDNQHPEPGGDGPPPDVERDTLLMIGTEQDNELCWIQAGQALGWLLLTLTVHGFSSQPLGQALDVEGSRLRLSGQIGLIGHVQFLLRTGIGHGAPTTGRRHASVAQ
jgi:hypothetical protein